MALRKCKECGNAISSKAMSCPQCGAPQKKRTSLLTWTITILLAVGFIGYIGSITENHSTQQSYEPEVSEIIHTSKGHVLADQVVKKPEAWNISLEKSPIDDSTNVSIYREAERSITGWSGSYIPKLMIRCKEDKTEMAVVTGMAANPELGNYGKATLTLRLDDGKAFKVNASDSTNNEALFFPRPITLIKKMFNKESLLVIFVPFNSGQQEMRFSLKNLNTAIKPLRKACHW